MNLIKFKNVIIDNDNIFNDNFRGRYCTVIYDENISYARPLCDIIIDEPQISIDEYSNYIDIEETSRINSTFIYEQANIIFNKTEIPISDLKQFRSKFAEYLIDLETLWKTSDINYNNRTLSMFKYYKNNMYDDVCKLLLDFDNIADISYNNIYNIQNNNNNLSSEFYNNIYDYKSVTNSCNCNNITLTNITNNSIKCLETYKYNIYKWMIIVFSDVDFWLKLNNTTPNFLDLFIKYLEGILLNNFYLNNITKKYNDIKYNDCNNILHNNDIYDIYLDNINTLNNLIISLQYIKNGEHLEHSAFIYKYLNKWSSNLYEIMKW